MKMVNKTRVRKEFTNLLDSSFNNNNLSFHSITKRPHSSVWEVRDSSSDTDYMVKYYHKNKDKSEREYVLFEQTNQHLESFDHLYAPEPVAYSIEEGILVTKKIAGSFKLLSHQLKRPHVLTNKYTSVIEKTGIWLKEFQNVPFPEHFQMHVYNHKKVDLAELFEKSSHSVGNQVDIDIEKLFYKMKQIEAEWPVSQYVFCHRDFTPWNVIHTQTGSIYVIDFATTCKSDPEYDVARFLSILRISGDFNSRNKLDRYCDAFMKGFDKDLNPKRLFYWRIVNLLTWLSRVDKAHKSIKANFSKYRMLKSLRYDLLKTVRLG